MPKGKYIAISKKIDQPEIREKCRQFGHETETSRKRDLFFEQHVKGHPSRTIRVELNELRNRV